MKRKLAFSNYRRIAANDEVNASLRSQLEALKVFSGDPDSVAEVVDVIDSSGAVQYQVVFYGSGEATVFNAGTTIEVIKAAQTYVYQYDDSELCAAIADAYERAEPSIRVGINFRAPQRKVGETALGELSYFEDQELWWAKVECAGRVVLFWIGGDYEPDPVLLKHSETIASDFEGFRETVFSFLEENPDVFAESGAEIEDVEIREVGCWYPDMPKKVNVYLAGTEDSPVWCCDVVDGKPTTLELEDSPLIDPEEVG